MIVRGLLKGFLISSQIESMSNINRLPISTCRSLIYEQAQVRNRYILNTSISCDFYNGSEAEDILLLMSVNNKPF